MRTRLSIGLFIGMLCIATLPIKAQTSIIFSFNDGTQQGNLLSSFKKVTFASGNLLLNNNDLTTNSFAVASIAKLTFGIYSGFAEVKADNRKMKVSPCPASDFIQLTNAPENRLTIQIFRTDGALLENKELLDNSEKIDIRKLNKGVYFIKVNDQTIKFVKR